MNNHELDSLGAVLFEDRIEAGRRLRAAIPKADVSNAVVCGLARGGVPVAAQVAEEISAPLDIIVVKKLRSPYSPDLAVGAVCADGAFSLRDDLIPVLRVSPAYVKDELAVRLRDAQDADADYRSIRDTVSVLGRTVVIVDDGIVTGSTVKAAVRSVRQRGAARVIVAVPLGSDGACREISGLVDGFFRVAEPSEFWARGQFYERFPAVTESEIAHLLARANEQAAPRIESTKLGV